MKSSALSGSMFPRSGASESTGEHPRWPSRPSPHMLSPPAQLSAVHTPSCGVAALEHSRHKECVCVAPGAAHRAAPSHRLGMCRVPAGPPPGLIAFLLPWGAGEVEGK